MCVFCKTLDLVSIIYVACVKRHILTLHEFHVYILSLLTVSIYMLNEISAYQTLAYNNNNTMLWIVLIRKMMDEYAHICKESTFITEYCNYCSKTFVEMPQGGC